jgi:hypothetical protein
MAESAFRGAIEFFDRLGVYDVLLPFLLIFTIFFAILERTRIFGVEKVGNTEIPKKNLNAMTAFVISLLVVASTRIVGIINRGLAQVGLLLVISISFLILAGSFFVNEDFKLGPGWQKFGMLFMGLGVLLVFANELGWLEPFWYYVTSSLNSSITGSILLLILIIWFISFVTKGEKTAEKKAGENP